MGFCRVDREPYLTGPPFRVCGNPSAIQCGIGFPFLHLGVSDGFTYEMSKTIVGLIGYFGAYQPDRASIDWSRNEL